MVEEAQFLGLVEAVALPRVLRGWKLELGELLALGHCSHRLVKPLEFADFRFTECYFRHRSICSLG